MIRNFLVISVIALSLYSAVAQKKKVENPPLEDSWVTASLADRGTFILETPDSTVWGCAPIYDDEGKVHVYYSKWQREGSWLIDSEIGHAVADHPEGPYRKLGTILDGREGKWDRHMVHNPSVYRIDDKYVLLYISNDTTKQHRWLKDGMASENLQVVGMAIADSPYGPWKRFDKPVIDISADSMAWDSYCAVNPTMLKHPNGEYWIYYRAHDRHNDDRRKTGLAIAKNLEGPYVKYGDKALIDHAEYGGQTEDPYIFYYKGMFHCLIRDMGNYDWAGNLYLSSDDGINWSDLKRGHWNGAKYYPVLEEKSRCERVQILWRDGEPEYLYNAIHRPDRGRGLNSGGVIKFNLVDSMRL
ncbi:MAG: glycoside hydrolase family protein [Rikenellaceae bacterium]